ncbi:YeeE/YedE thiosulfate transporter family protein [Magnetococcales bacterium HHB-1]
MIMNHTWTSPFNTVYNTLREPFQTSWLPNSGALLLVLAVAVLLINGEYWGVFAGFRYTGDAINQFLGLSSFFGTPEHLGDPLNHRIFVSDMVLIAAAMASAMIGGHFKLTPPPPMEYLNAAFGGILMGVGATLAGGCTVGGFFTPLIFSSPAGWMMLLGLMMGAAIGVRMLLWWMDAVPWGTAPKPMLDSGISARLFPLLGWIILVSLLFWAIDWMSAENLPIVKKGYIVLAAIGIGIVLQRSRLCFSKAVREPFMTGDGSHAKAVMLAILIITPLAALIIDRGGMDVYGIIPPRFWLGSLFGGLIFGIGMVFAGGCATSTLWRFAEGNIKMLFTLLFFAWSGSVSAGLMGRSGWLERDFDLDYLDGVPAITELGAQVFMKDILGGWGWAILFASGMVALWYLLIRYNERTERFTVF